MCFNTKSLGARLLRISSTFYSKTEFSTIKFFFYLQKAFSFGIWDQLWKKENLAIITKQGRAD